MLEFKSSDGRKLEFEAAPLGQGGEGAVHKQYDHLGYGDVGDLAKIFNPGKREGKEAKLKAMMEIRSPRPSHSYAWPKELLYDLKTGEFCGYVMYLKQNKIELGDIYGYNSPYRTEGSEKMKEWRYFVALARNLARAVAGVHDIGQVIGDLNDKNILIDPETYDVTLIDTDSFHINRMEETYRCVVGKSEYVPKEVQNVKFASAALPTFTRHTDNFSLAVLIFKLLMNGVHPFNSVGIDEKSIEDNIGDGRSPFFANYAKLNTAFYAPTADMLPPVLRKLFEVAFVTGTNNPEKRPSAIEFYDELVKLEKSENLYSCTAKQWHIFPSATSECPWCAIERRQEERMQQIAALSVLTSNVAPDYSVARYNPVQNYQKAQDEQAAAKAAQAAAAAAKQEQEAQDAQDAQAAREAKAAAAVAAKLEELAPPVKPTPPAKPTPPVKPEALTPPAKPTPPVKPEALTPPVKPTPPTKPEIPAAEEKFSSKENIVIVPSDAAAASPAPTHKSKNKIYAIAGAAAALVLLVVGIAVISALRGDGPPVESQSPPSSEATPEITEPTSANGSLMTSPATSTGGEATEPSVSPVTEPPSDTEAAPDTPDTPPSASVASGTATTTRATTTAATVLTLPTTTATTRVLTTAVTTRTNPTTVATTRPTTPTTVPTTAPTTATTARRPVETRIFDMQTDPNLARFAGLGSSAQSTHALLGSHGADRVVDTTSTPRTIAITRRGGGSQGVFINLDQITLTPNATYRFDFSGSVTSATGTHTIDFTSVTDTSGRGSDVATLRSVTTSANGSFTLTHSLTQYDISVMHARGVRRLRLGGASGQDLLITGILIREVV